MRAASPFAMAVCLFPHHNPVNKVHFGNLTARSGTRPMNDSATKHHNKAVFDPILNSIPFTSLCWLPPVLRDAVFGSTLVVLSSCFVIPEDTHCS